MNAAGTLSINNSTFSNNTAKSSGGALNINGSANIQVTGIIAVQSIIYKDQSLTSFVADGVYPVSDGVNLVAHTKIEIPADTPDGAAIFEEMNELYNQAIASGDVVGNIDDLPVVPSSPETTAQIAELMKEIQGVTVIYKGEILGTYYQNLGGSGESVELGLADLSNQLAGNATEYTIKNTIFQNNTANNGGAVAIQNTPISVDSVLDFKSETVDLSDVVTTKEEALAMIDEALNAGELLTSDKFFSDEYTISAPAPNVTFINTSFLNNTAQNKGGAIYANTDLTIKADNGQSLFQGNTANGQSNAIYMDNSEKN